jgi:hypothetical protein
MISIKLLNALNLMILGLFCFTDCIFLVDILYSKFVFWLRKPAFLFSIEPTENL